MNANNGWPGKPGVPLNPERDGPHWLCHNEIDQEEAALWDAKGNFWQLIGTDDTFSPRDLVVRKWGYVGPVLTPDEATALQARVAELEAALRRIEYRDPEEGAAWFHEVARAALGGKDE